MCEGVHLSHCAGERQGYQGSAHLYADVARGVNLRLGLGGTAPGDGNFDGLKLPFVPASAARGLALPAPKMALMHVDVVILQGYPSFDTRPECVPLHNMPTTNLLVMGQAVYMKPRMPSNHQFKSE